MKASLGAWRSEAPTKTDALPIVRLPAVLARLVGHPLYIENTKKYEEGDTT